MRSLANAMIARNSWLLVVFAHCWLAAHATSRISQASSRPAATLAEASAFHHVEVLCGDATQLRHMLATGLGLEMTACSDLSTGNAQSTSFCLRSGDVRVVCTAPQPSAVRSARLLAGGGKNSKGEYHMPTFDAAAAEAFVQQHGVAVRAIGLRVPDVRRCFERMTELGAESAMAPATISDERGTVHLAEVQLYGDVRLRLVDDADFRGEFLPTYADVPRSPRGRFGIERFDHIVGNVWKLAGIAKRIQTFTGFHEFAEFTAADVGTADSGLNSVVLANAEDTVLLPLNEPTYGTKRQSQIATYLAMNGGPGVQHIALSTSDIIA
jgi:4-hydroxyphenylpyruvate dioxygenase